MRFFNLAVPRDSAGRRPALSHRAALPVLLWLLCSLAPRPASAVPGGETVGVMPFRDLSGGGSPIGEALRETVTTDLKERSGLRVIERADLDRILTEQKLQSQRTDLDPSTAARVGKLLGATLMVAGACQRADRAIRLTARVVRVETGEIIGTAKVDGKEGEILRLQDRVTSELLRSAGLKEKAKHALARPRPALKSLKVIELYNQAVQEPDDLQRLNLLKLASAEDSTFLYAANDLRALEARLRTYQRGDEAARLQSIVDLTRRLAAATDPAGRYPIVAELLAKLQQAGRYRQMVALAQKADADGYLPEENRDLPAFFRVLADLKLKDQRLLLRDGEDFLQRSPGSPYFSAVKNMVEQAIKESRQVEEGRAEAAAAEAKLHTTLRWDLCQLAQVYRRYRQFPEERRLLLGCLAVGKRPRSEVLRLLVAADMDCADFARARQDLAELDRVDPEAGRATRKIADIPADG